MRALYRWLFPDYEKELKRACVGSVKLLDIGCGDNSPIQSFSKNLYSVGFDAFAPSIEASKNKGIHSAYLEGVVKDLPLHFGVASFDTVLASDLIEHLTKEEGIKLIATMERIATKKVIIFTPVGFLPQAGVKNNPFQEHKSGWSVEDFKKQGYDVIGINGLRCLRGEFAGIRWKPKWFWIIISDITQLWTRNRPKYAFQQLAIKEK